MAKPIPIALLSDSPDCPSGLARITRDLAGRLYKSSLPVRVATVGFNGQASKAFPWQQYNVGPFANSSNIPQIVPSLADWFGEEQGILFSIYDLQRLEAFRFPQLYGGSWQAYLGQERSPFYLMGYLPIDSHAPRVMTQQSLEILRAFDGVLGYGPYGDGILAQCLDSLSGPKPKHYGHAPHGLDMGVFCPRGLDGRARLRRQIQTDLKDGDGNPIFRTLEVLPEDHLLGVVGTNQVRKDWATAIELLSKLGPEWKLWAHTDKLMGYWSLPDLFDQYGVTDRCFVSMGLDDEALAELYSACDVTFGLGRGEGFGYPLVESLACGTPCVHAKYAGGADLLPEQLLFRPDALKVEGPYCLQRPILSAEEVRQKILDLPTDLDYPAWVKDRFDWNRIWPKTWEPMFKSLLDEFKVWRKV